MRWFIARSDQLQSNQVKEDDKSQGLAGSLVTLGRVAIGIIPPQFLALCGINVLFLWLLFTFLGHQIDARQTIVGHIVNACMEQMLVHNLERR